MAEPLKLVKPPEQEQLQTKKQFTIVHFAGILSAVMVLGLSYDWFIYSARHISTDNAYVDTDLFPVNCRIMGYVKEVKVKEGDLVTKGETLALLDDTDFNVELSYKESRYKKAMSDLGRGKALVRTDAISKSDFETAQANVAGLKADLDGTLLKLKYTHITSPIDGYVSKKSVEPGQFVQPGQSLFVVIPKDDVWIKANFKETQLEKIKVGDPVDVKIDAYPGVAWKGKVESILPTSGAKMSLIPPENGTGNFTKIVQRIPVRIEVEQRTDRVLRPGMSAQPTILVQ